MQLSTASNVSSFRERAPFDTLLALTDWTDRYHYLLELGERMPVLPSSYRQAGDRVPGCASAVWIAASGDALQFDYLGAAECPMDAGLVALAMSVYAGNSAEDIVATPPHFIREAGLIGRFTQQRLRGLCAVVERMRELALRCLMEARIPVGNFRARQTPCPDDGVRILRLRAL